MLEKIGDNRYRLAVATLVLIAAVYLLTALVIVVSGVVGGDESGLMGEISMEAAAVNAAVVAGGVLCVLWIRDRLRARGRRGRIARTAAGLWLWGHRRNGLSTARAAIGGTFRGWAEEAEAVADFKRHFPGVPYDVVREIDDVDGA